MRLVWILFMALSFGACSEIEPNVDRKTRTDVLSKSEMVDIMFDLHIIQAAYKGRSHNDSTAAEKRNIRTLELFKQRGIDQAYFTECLKYYHKEAEDMEEITEAVLTKLNARLAEIEESID